MQTEKTLLGLLKMDKRQARAFIWDMGINERCKKIKREVTDEIGAENAELLKSIANRILKVADDRNIIIHGLVHAIMIVQKDDGNDHGIIPIEKATRKNFSRVPCWTVFKGEGKGKNYEMSFDAVSILFDNIYKLGDELSKFNVKNGFIEKTEQNDFIETNWPTRL